MKPTLTLLLVLLAILMVARAALETHQFLQREPEAIALQGGDDPGGDYDTDLRSRDEALRTADSDLREVGWAALEHEDLEVYARNLRAVECPPETLRDILVGHFRRYLETPRSRGLEADFYWSASYAPALTAGFDTIDEMDVWAAALAEILGPRELDLSFLDSLDAARVRKWLRTEATDDDGVASRARAAAPFGSAADSTDEREQQLSEILTARKFEEYQLRYSRLADELRASLVGFGVTEREFRRLFHTLNEERQALLQGVHLDATLRLQEILGQDRFERYELAQSAEFRAVHAAMADCGRTYDATRVVFRTLTALREMPKTDETLETSVASLKRRLSTLHDEDLALVFEHFALQGRR